VEYCLDEGYNAGQWRPAMVVVVREAGELNLQVWSYQGEVTERRGVCLSREVADACSRLVITLLCR
jgi:hypothetical protein